MLSTENDPNETLYSEQDFAQSFEENLTKNFSNSIIPATNINEESGNKFDELICNLIKKQTEHDNKAKNEISSRIKEALSNISDRIKREQSHIYDYKFRDYLASIGFDNESSSQLTNYCLDTYDGSLSLNEIQTFFQQFESCCWKFNSELHFEKMITCSLMPGLLDAFTDEKFFPYNQLAAKLFQFILSHRLPAELINAPYLENSILVANLRRKILLENENKFYEEIRKNKSIYVDEQCISSLKSCCCQEKIHNIIDGKWMSYWQTTNSEKWEDHYILIMLKENLKLTNLSLFSIGNKTDEFLKSIVIEVRTGGPEKLETVVSKCDYNLTLNNEYSICNCFPNNQNITYLKIVFKRLNEKSYWAKVNDQLKIRSIKLVGQKVVSQAPSLSVQDASICWYFEMLSAMALVQSQLMPSLHAKILQITKNALENMPPLSLTLESKKTFLTPTVLDKVDSFLKDLLEVTSTSVEDKSEAILIYVSFNLARGNLKGIMKSLLLILENFQLEYEFSSLIAKINEASQLSLRKTAQKVGFKSLKIANEPKSEKLNETEIILTVEDENTEFSLESYRSSKESPFEINSCFNIVLEIESNVTLTNVNLKLKVESIGIHSVVVILIFDKTRPKIEKFTQFDSFTSKEQFNSYIKNSQSNKKSCLYEAFYFELYENQIDIMLEVPFTNMSNYAIIKLLRSKENSPKTINISNVNLVGFRHSSLDIFENLKSLPSSLDKGNSPASILVSAILWLCCQLAEQHKNLALAWDENEVKLLDLENFEIDDLWKIYLKSMKLIEKSSDSTDFLLSNLKVPILILLFELVNCAEMKSNLKQTKSSHILQSLCNIIDAYEGDKKNGNLDKRNQMLLDITREIIRNGVGVFFQQDELIEFFDCLVKQNLTSADISNDPNSFKQDMSLNRTSNQILFQAFCKQLTENKLGLIQYLTKSQNPYENFTELNQIILFLEKFINLIFNHELSIDFDTECKLMRASNQLVNSIQSNVLYNIQNKIRSKQIDKDCIFENMMIKHINNFINDYAKFLFKKSYDLQNLFQKSEKNRIRYQSRLESFLRNILYNFVLWLTSIFEKLESSLCTVLSSECANLLNSINKTFFSKSIIEKKCEKEILLKSWNFNSKTKSSIFDLAEEYSYPLAKRFVIELDTECKLNNSECSDSISFTFIDSNEQVHNITKKAENKEIIDHQIEINSDSSIIFNIHSSKDLKLNNHFFLKFTVNAYGFDQSVNKPRIVDLVHSLSCLMGTNLHKVSSEIYSTNHEIPQTMQSSKVTSIEKQNSKDESSDKAFLLCGFQHQFSVNSSTQAQIGPNEKYQAVTNMNHEYYRILFRSGIQNLPIKNSPSDQKLHKFLLSVSNHLSKWLNSPDPKNPCQIVKFLSLYDKTFSNSETSLGSLKSKIGGLSASEIIIKIFCAIVWYDTSISYEDAFDEEDSPVFSEKVMKHYKTAESTRMYIVEKQLIFKNKQAHFSRSLAEILDEKIMFLLNFNRISSDLIDYELNRNSKSASSDPADSLVHVKKKNRLPKTESKITNLIFQFLFDQEILKLDSVEKLLFLKKQNSDLIQQNFDIASNFLENLIQSGICDQLICELVLLFLSSFFASNSNSAYTKFEFNSTRDRIRAYIASGLKPIMTHYLQNLYGCGIENEALVQKSFYNFVKILLNFSKSLEDDYYKLSVTDKDRYIRLKSFVTCLLDIDWELKDLKMIQNLHLYGYLVKNMIISMPICEYKDERQLSPSQILEDFFDFSQEKFEEVMKTANNKEYLAREKSTGSALPSVQEVEEKEESVLDKSMRPEDESFDTKIFPGMYQSLFQINSSKQFDTTSLLKSVSSAITTHEQYQKYLVARYMFWKYFSKLNTNFYCDKCEAILTGFRYVCLECRDYCYCFTCFSKSIVEKKGDSLEKCHKPLVDVSKSSSHKPTHPMLVLDHYCNQCQSLIIGKRLKCLDCFDFDLCLACSKKPEFSQDGHKHHHTTKMIEPTILTSKSCDSSDAQIFLYLHSHFLFTNLGLKMCDFLNKYGSTENQHAPLIRHMYSEVVNTLLFLTSRTDMEPSDQENDFVRDLKFFMFYNQKSIISQLAYVIKSTKHAIKENGSLESIDFDFDAAKNFFDSLASESTLQADPPNLLKILNYIVTLQDKVYHNVFADNISIMFIGMMRSWFGTLDPESVNKLAKNHLDKNENNFIFQELDESKREYTLELIFCWIYEYMISGFDKLACSYLDLMFGMNQMEQWKPHVQNFLSNVLDKISESLDSYKPRTHSKFYFLIYAIICFQMDISSGQWVDYKSKSQYDGAGILRSTDNYKIGLANNFYSVSFLSDSCLSIKDPESRRTVKLKYKKLDNTWRKSNEKSKIPIKSSFDLNQDFFLKLIEIFKKIFATCAETVDSSSFDAEDSKSIGVYEKNHISKKREFYKFYKQKMGFNKNLLVFGLINLMQSYVGNAFDDEQCVDLQAMDAEFLRLVSKISFLNTNLNSNWKSNHLNIFLTSLLLFDNFAHIKNSLEREQCKEETPTSETKTISRSLNSISGEKGRLNRTTDLDEVKKHSSKDDLSSDDLLGEQMSAVMSVCDISSRVFPMEDMISNFVDNRESHQPRNKASLKLIEDCFNKLSKYESNKSEDGKSGQLFPKQQAGEPVRAAIKIICHACIVLSSRELLVLMINLSAKLAKTDLDLVPKKESFLELSLNSEYELIQLLDVLFYSEKELNFKYLVKNFIRSYLGKDKSNGLMKILNKICTMACDFMLPEFKLLRKVSWSYDDVRFYDVGKLKNKNSNESLSEENINFNSSQIAKTLNEFEKLTSITSKPNDVEKLSTQDQSTLLIVFDQDTDTKAKMDNLDLNKNKFGGFFGKSIKKSNYAKYCLGDDFEFKDEVFSDTESINSIEESDSAVIGARKKSIKKNKSLCELTRDLNSSLDEDEDETYDEDSTVCSENALDKKNSQKTKKTSILFQIVPEQKNSNSRFNEDYDDEEQDQDEEEADDEDEESHSESENSTSSDESSNYEFNIHNSRDDFYDEDRWEVSANNTGYTDNQENRTKKKKFKISLESLSTIPFIAIRNEKMLKWKFCRSNADLASESCSFKIFTTLSKNFESAYCILDEIISQTNFTQLALDDLWCSLIRICCVQTFNRRLKVLSLLIKMIQKIYQASNSKPCINIFAVKPLRNLHLMVESYNTEDKNFSRALYELFFFVEKLAIKWSIQDEYLAKMRDKEYFLEKVAETAHFINLLMGSLNETSSENLDPNSKLNTIQNLFNEADSQTSDEDEDEDDDVDDVDDNDDDDDDEIYSSPQGCSRKNSDEEYRESREEIDLFEENW